MEYITILTDKTRGIFFISTGYEISPGSREETSLRI